MTYQFKSEVTAGDFWKLTMNRTYRSMAGVCNLIFTMAMILFTVRFFRTSNDPLQVLMLFGCLLFPVIQPIAIYLKAKGQVRAMPKGVELAFDEKGLHVTMDTQHENIGWNKLRVAKQPGMMIVFSDARHGYMLTNRVLGTQKDAFYAFAEARIEQAD